MPEVTGHNARLAVPTQHVFRTNRTSKTLDPRIELADIEHQVAELKGAATAFKADMDTKIQDPNSRGRARVASMVESRLEVQSQLEEKRKGLLIRSKALVGRLDALEWNEDINKHPDLVNKLPELRDKLIQATATTSMFAWFRIAEEKQSAHSQQWRVAEAFATFPTNAGAEAPGEKSVAAIAAETLVDFLHHEGCMVEDVQLPLPHRRRRTLSSHPSYTKRPIIT